MDNFDQIQHISKRTNRIIEEFNESMKKSSPKKPRVNAAMKHQRDMPKAVPPLNKPLISKFMKAKELDTKINLLRKAGKSPRDFVDLLDEFQRNSTEIEIESRTPTINGANHDKDNKG